MVCRTQELCPQNLFFKNISKIQKSYVPLYDIVLLTLTHIMTVIDKVTIFCNDVNKTSTSVELLAMLHVIKK